MDKKRHILFISNTAFSMWNFRSHILAHLKYQDFKITCVAKDDEYSKNIIEMGVDFISVPLSRSGTNIILELRAIYNFFKIIHRLKPDIIFTYTIKPNSYIPLLAKCFNIPVVCVVTGLGYAFLQNNLRAVISRTILKYSLELANHVWFLNKDDKKRLDLKNKSSSILSGEGVDTQYFSSPEIAPKNSDDFIFIMISRILKDKGILEYVAAAKDVKKEYPHVQCQVLGALDDGNPAAISPVEWDFLCRDSGVEYLGTTKDVKPYLARADVSVLPSYREGLPVGLLESGAMGLPIIASNVAGCRDVVEHGLNGFLVKPYDAKDLAYVMKSMIDMNDDTFRDMSKNARDIVCEKFDNAIIQKKYDQMLNKILGKNEK